MLTNSGGILFKNMAAQNIDLNFISGLSEINEADLNSMLNGYLTSVNDEVFFSLWIFSSRIEFTL